jgi:hypothetical protein
VELDDADLKFIKFIDNKNIIITKTPEARERMLGTAWKLRTELPMVRYLMALVEFGNAHFSSCRDIICRINTLRKQRNPSSSDGSWPQVNLMAHDEISGFDSEAGDDGAGAICVNLLGRYAWKDKTGKLWYVPQLIVVFHELGHYLQYLYNPKYYNEVAASPIEGQHHLLDAMNMPDNEYPICRDLNMGVREYYLDMQEVRAPQFAGLELNYTRVLEKKYARDEHGFSPATEPEDSVRAREAQERLAREKRGAVGLGGGNTACAVCNTMFPSPMKARIHQATCKMVACDRCKKQMPSAALAQHAPTCAGAS